MSVRHGSYRADRLGNWPGRSLGTKSAIGRASDLAGRNASERRATGSRSVLAVSGFRLRARLDFSIPSCSPGQRGITPAFGYSAPHPSAEGTSTPMIHALPSAHYDPVRLPSDPSTYSMLKARPSIEMGLPRLPALPFQRAMPITPVNQTGACIDCFPAYAAFPAIRPGRHPHCNFRGVLRLHSRYGPLDCSAA